MLAVGPAHAGPGDAPTPASAYRFESGPFELGLGVSTLRPGAPDPTAPASNLSRLTEPDVRTYDPRAAAISFDLKLRWPTAAGTADAPAAALVPYLALGPALLISESPYAPLTPREAPGDYAVSLGLKGGAGVSWRLGPSASFFGEYGFTRAADEHRSGTGRGGDGFDTQGFRYGVQIKF